MHWDKKLLKKMLRESLEADMKAILLAASTAHEGATHSDAQAKSKYDTHGLELSYIAGSQYERARVMQLMLQKLDGTSFEDYQDSDEIDVGAIVTIEMRNGQQSHLWLSPVGAGVVIACEEVELRVISPESPLGERLIGLTVGESLQMGAGASERVTVRGIA